LWPVSIDSLDNEKTQNETTLVRPVGAIERILYRYAERNPTHFLLVAEFDIVLAEDQLRAAPLAIQQCHPLLSVHVEDRPGSHLGFYRAESVARIELAVHERYDSEWQLLAAEELARPFDRSAAPLMRAVLLKGQSSSALLLTFDHTIADGISSVIVLKDLVDSLNGHHLTPRDVPPSQEETIALRLPSSNHQPIPEPAVPDARMLKPSSIRPFDGTRPHVRTVALRGPDTSRLVNRCRAEQTTVNAAIVAASSRVRATLRGEDFFRVASPINIRSTINVGDGCADYIGVTVTGVAPWDGSQFWDQARAVTAELSVARSAEATATLPAMMGQAIPVDAETHDAEQFITTGMPWDSMISNLGVQDLATSGAISPTALWGPILNTQVDDDYITGVATYQGRLRMVACGYTPTEEYLQNLATTLVHVSS
jgi:condensation domain-containing protein